MRSFLKWSLILAGVVGVLVLIVYGIENHRGAKVWAETVAYLEAEGEPLDLADLIPPIPPGDQNFCAAPLVASMFDFESRQRQRQWESNTEYEEPEYGNPEQHDRIAAIKLPYPENRDEMPRRVSLLNGDLPELEAWAKIFRDSADFQVSDPGGAAAEQVLSALERFDVEFAELAAAAERPESVFPVDWPEGEDFRRITAMESPHLSELNQLGKMLKLRGVAALSAGEPEIARESVAIILKFVQGVENQPSLIYHMVEITNRVHALNVIWFGLRERAWQMEDLIWFENELASGDSYDSALTAIRSELIVNQIYGGDYLKNGGFESAKALAGFSGMDDGVATVFYVALPDGTWDRGKSQGCRFIYDGFIRPLKAENHSVLAGGSAVPLPGRTMRYRWTTLAAPVIEKIVTNVIYTRMNQRLALAACALERFYLEKGSYPGTDLAELTPEFLQAVPLDLMDGKPIRYLRTAESRYRIYSIGANLTDDGGLAVFPMDDLKPVRDQGDWVWAYSFPERAVVEP